MSFLFCSWATEGVEENGEKHSETEEEKTKNDISSSDVHKISEDSKEIKKGEINESNGELVSKNKEEVKRGQA